ncbi:MAG: hypothetical protein AB7O66_25770, partial [Limisphaerales bacterium]
WRYLDVGSNQGSAWRLAGFIEAAWRQGIAQFGYGDGDEVTSLRSAVNGARSTTFYFRRTFNVSDLDSVTDLTVHLLRDDGAMVYLNNQLVFRSNMPEGNVTSSTVASEVVGGADESTFFPQTVDPAVLVSGSNILAVEVHQQNSTSTDVSFDLRLEAKVTSANRPPTADAGPDLQAVAGQGVRLTGQFTDDGLPLSPGVATLSWTQTEGPSASTITAGNTSRPTVTFPVAGRYVLWFSVNDGASTVTDSVTVDVTGGGGETFDTWLRRHFSEAELGQPSISGEGADPDDDGQSNRNEFDSGTHPRDRESVLRLLGVRTADGKFLLGARVAKGRTYTILSRRDADGAAWEVVRHLEAGDCDCDVDVPLGNSAASDPTRFYRIVTPRLP